MFELANRYLKVSHLIILSEMINRILELVNFKIYEHWDRPGGFIGFFFKDGIVSLLTKDIKQLHNFLPGSNGVMQCLELICIY